MLACYFFTVEFYTLYAFVMTAMTTEFKILLSGTYQLTVTIDNSEEHGTMDTQHFQLLCNTKFNKNYSRIQDQCPPHQIQGRIQNFSQERAPIPRGAPTQYFDNIFWKTLWN